MHAGLTVPTSTPFRTRQLFHDAFVGIYWGLWRGAGIKQARRQSAFPLRNRVTLPGMSSGLPSVTDHLAPECASIDAS